MIEELLRENIEFSKGKKKVVKENEGDHGNAYYYQNGNDNSYFYQDDRDLDFETRSPFMTINYRGYYTDEKYNKLLSICNEYGVSLLNSSRIDARKIYRDRRKFNEFCDKIENFSKDNNAKLIYFNR